MFTSLIAATGDVSHNWHLVQQLINLNLILNVKGNGLLLQN